MIQHCLRSDHAVHYFGEASHVSSLCVLAGYVGATPGTYYRQTKNVCV